MMWLLSEGYAPFFLFYPPTSRVPPSKRKFLGYTVTVHRKPLLRVAPQSVTRLRMKVKEILRKGRGRSVRRTIDTLNPILRGWYTYFQHVETKATFEALDQWLRRRLRLILWRQWKHQLGMFSFLDRHLAK
jgi:RNA-directed DNA polymerase